MSNTLETECVPELILLTSCIHTDIKGSKGSDVLLEISFSETLFVSKYVQITLLKNKAALVKN